MAPMVVDWKASQPEGPDGFAIVHNINHGGNPIQGTTVLCSAKIPLNGIESVEFVLVPLDKLAKEGLIQHGQLRFIFAEDTPVELIHMGDKTIGSDTSLHDLVLSWEAWRPPDAGYNVLTGMDPGAYLLSPRLFSGPQRFLEDALGKRDWFGHRLRLPGGPRGLSEILKVGLALGDGVARHAISQVLELGANEWLEHAPHLSDESESDKAEWDKLLQMHSLSPLAEVPLIGLEEKDQAYQSLLRSCATMALYVVNVTVDRLVAAGHTDGLVLDKLMKPDLGQQEDWMNGLENAGLAGIFRRAPAAMRFLRANPTGWPKVIPRALEQAGLVEKVDGEPVRHQYSLEKTTPYGTLTDNLIT